MRRAIAIAVIVAAVFSVHGSMATAAGPPSKAAARTSKTPPAAMKVEPPSTIKQWGAMAGLVDRIWLLTNAAPQRYVGYKWETPGRVLLFEGYDRAGNRLAGKYELDVQTGQIGGITLTKGSAALSTVSPSATGYVEEGQDRGIALRQSFQLVSSARFDVTSEVMKRGKWVSNPPNSYVAVPETLISALGWDQLAATSAVQGPSFLREIGAAMKAGALAGLADGLHEGVRDGLRDKTQNAIAGDKTVPRE